MPGTLKISECLKMQTCISKTDYNHLAASLGISSPLKNWYITRRRGKMIYPCTPILNLKLVFRSHMTQPPLQPGQGLDHHQRRTGTQSFPLPRLALHMAAHPGASHAPVMDLGLMARLYPRAHPAQLPEGSLGDFSTAAAGWGQRGQCQLCTRAAQQWLPIFKALSL